MSPRRESRGFLGRDLDLEIFPETGDDLVVDLEIAFVATKRNLNCSPNPVAGLTTGVNPAADAQTIDARPTAASRRRES